MKHSLVIAAAFALCPLALHAQVNPPVAAPVPAAPAPAPSGPAVSLRYKFAVGQVHRYQYDMDMNMLMQTGQTGGGIPISMLMRMTVRQTVKSIRPSDGAATLVSQIETLHMLRNGQETPLPEAQQEKMKLPFSQVMLPTGKILSMDLPSLNGVGAPGMDLSKNLFSGTPLLPDGPVRVGDHWSGQMEAATAGVETKFTSTLTSLDQKDGSPLATIHNEQTGTIDKTLTQGTPVPVKMQGPVTGTATQVFDPASGTIVSATGTTATDITMTFGKAADGTTPPGMPSAMKMQMQMKFKMQTLSAAPSAVPPTQ